MMKAMVLAAGFGTRLMPLTRLVPKPVFPVMNRPLLAHTLDLLRSFDIRDITVNVHHLPEKIIRDFGDGSKFGVRLHFSEEKEILGTAGGIKKAQSHLDGGPFVVINSDILTDVDLNRVLEFHKQKKSCLTLVVRKDDSPEKFDPIEIDGNGRIVHFVGASSMNVPDDTTRVMFTGVQIMEPGIFDRIPSGRFCGTAEEIFPEMIREGLPVHAYMHDGYWIDMGTRESYLSAHRDSLDGKIKLSGAPPHHPAGASIIPPVSLGENCRIAEGATVGPYTVMGKDCRVGSGAIIEHSVCWDGVTVGADCSVKQSILADGVVVPDKQKIIGQSLMPDRQ